MLWENGRELRINLVRIDDKIIKSEPLSPPSLITGTARKRTSRTATARKRTSNQRTYHQVDIPIFVPRNRQPSFDRTDSVEPHLKKIVEACVEPFFNESFAFNSKYNFNPSTMTGKRSHEPDTDSSEQIIKRVNIHGIKQEPIDDSLSDNDTPRPSSHKASRDDELKSTNYVCRDCGLVWDPLFTNVPVNLFFENLANFQKKVESGGRQVLNKKMFVTMLSSQESPTPCFLTCVTGQNSGIGWEVRHTHNIGQPAPSGCQILPEVVFDAHRDANISSNNSKGEDSLERRIEVFIPVKKVKEEFIVPNDVENIYSFSNNADDPTQYKKSKKKPIEKKKKKKDVKMTVSTSYEYSMSRPGDKKVQRKERRSSETSSVQDPEYRPSGQEIPRMGLRRKSASPIKDTKSRPLDKEIPRMELRRKDTTAVQDTDFEPIDNENQSKDVTMTVATSYEYLMSKPLGKEVQRNEARAIDTTPFQDTNRTFNNEVPRMELRMTDTTSVQDSRNRPLDNEDQRKDTRMMDTSSYQNSMSRPLDNEIQRKEVRFSDTTPFQDSISRPLDKEIQRKEVRFSDPTPFQDSMSRPLDKEIQRREVRFSDTTPFQDSMSRPLDKEVQRKEVRFSDTTPFQDSRSMPFDNALQRQEPMKDNPSFQVQDLRNKPVDNENQRKDVRMTDTTPIQDSRNMTFGDEVQRKDLRMTDTTPFQNSRNRPLESEDHRNEIRKKLVFGAEDCIEIERNQEGNKNHEEIVIDGINDEVVQSVGKHLPPPRQQTTIISKPFTPTSNLMAIEIQFPSATGEMRNIRVMFPLLAKGIIDAQIQTILSSKTIKEVFALEAGLAANVLQNRLNEALEHKGFVIPEELKKNKQVMKNVHFIPNKDVEINTTQSQPLNRQIQHGEEESNTIQSQPINRQIQHVEETSNAIQSQPINRQIQHVEETSNAIQSQPINRQIQHVEETSNTIQSQSLNRLLQHVEEKSNTIQSQPINRQIQHVEETSNTIQSQSLNRQIQYVEEKTQPINKQIQHVEETSNSIQSQSLNRQIQYVEEKSNTIQSQSINRQIQQVEEKRNTIQSQSLNRQVQNFGNNDVSTSQQNTIQSHPSNRQIQNMGTTDFGTRNEVITLSSKEDDGDIEIIQDNEIPAKPKVVINKDEEIEVIEEKRTPLKNKTAQPVEKELEVINQRKNKQGEIPDIVPKPFRKSQQSQCIETVYYETNKYGKKYKSLPQRQQIQQIQRNTMVRQNLKVNQNHPSKRSMTSFSKNQYIGINKGSRYIQNRIPLNLSKNNPGTNPMYVKRPMTIKQMQPRKSLQAGSSKLLPGQKAQYAQSNSNYAAVQAQHSQSGANVNIPNQSNLNTATGHQQEGYQISSEATNAPAYQAPHGSQANVTGTHQPNVNIVGPTQQSQSKQINVVMPLHHQPNTSAVAPIQGAQGNQINKGVPPHHQSTSIFTPVQKRHSNQNVIGIPPHLQSTKSLTNLMPQAHANNLNVGMPLHQQSTPSITNPSSQAQGNQGNQGVPPHHHSNTSIIAPVQQTQSSMATKLQHQSSTRIIASQAQGNQVNLGVPPHQSNMSTVAPIQQSQSGMGVTLQHQSSTSMISSTPDAHGNPVNLSGVSSAYQGQPRQSQQQLQLSRTNTFAPNKHNQGNITHSLTQSSHGNVVSTNLPQSNNGQQIAIATGSVLTQHQIQHNQVSNKDATQKQKIDVVNTNTYTVLQPRNTVLQPETNTNISAHQVQQNLLKSSAINSGQHIEVKDSNTYTVLQPRKTNQQVQKNPGPVATDQHIEVRDSNTYTVLQPRKKIAQINTAQHQAQPGSYPPQMSQTSHPNVAQNIRANQGGPSNANPYQPPQVDNSYSDPSQQQVPAGSNMTDQNRELWGNSVYGEWLKQKNESDKTISNSMKQVQNKNKNLSYSYQSQQPTQGLQPQTVSQQNPDNSRIYQYKCPCGIPGYWYECMLECQSCKRWFHEKCVSCLRFKLICGDLFYVFVCQGCNSGKDFLYRLPITWEDLVQLALFNLSHSDSSLRNHGFYFDIEQEITPWIDKNWELLQCGLDQQNITVSYRVKHILSALNSNPKKFRCGKEIRKKSSLWALRNNEPPYVLSVILPKERPITAETIKRVSFQHRTTNLPPIPKNFRVDLKKNEAVTTTTPIYFDPNTTSQDNSEVGGPSESGNTGAHTMTPQTNITPRRNIMAQYKHGNQGRRVYNQQRGSFNNLKLISPTYISGNQILWQKQPDINTKSAQYFQVADIFVDDRPIKMDKHSNPKKTIRSISPGVKKFIIDWIKQNYEATPSDYIKKILVFKHFMKSMNNLGMKELNHEFIIKFYMWSVFGKSVLKGSYKEIQRIYKGVKLKSIIEVPTAHDKILTKRVKVSVDKIEVHYDFT